MRILYICHRFPFPPNRGGKIRPFNVIKHLSQDHEVVVASLTRSREEAEAGEGLARHCSRYIMQPVSETMAIARMFARLPTTTPSSMGYFYSPGIASRIREELGRTKFDLIFVHCSSVAQYVKDVTDTPKLLDFGDMDSQKWLAYASFRRFPLSLGYRYEGMRLQRAEVELAKRFDLCTCTTTAEKETLDCYEIGVPTDWFPNGVNHEYFSPTEEPYDPNLIGFVGRMDYYPNAQGIIDFCEKILPLVRRRRPSTRLVIVGAKPMRAVLNLRQLEGVSVTGSVEDVRPFVRQSALSVAPLKIARGTQNKILESLAMGVPTVSSEIAARGVDAIPGEHLLTASAPQEFADAVVSLLENPERRQALSAAGRARVLSNHSWNSSMQRVDKIVMDCVSLFHRARRRPGDLEKNAVGTVD